MYPVPSANNRHRAWDQYSACVWNTTVLSLKGEAPAIFFLSVVMWSFVDNRKLMKKLNKIDKKSQKNQSKIMKMHWKSWLGSLGGPLGGVLGSSWLPESEKYKNLEFFPPDTGPLGRPFSGLWAIFFSFFDIAFCNVFLKGFWDRFLKVFGWIFECIFC